MSPLRRRLIEDMQIRNLAPSTQRAYVAQLVHFACYFRKSPDLLGPAEIRAYLIYLAQEKCLAASSIIVTVSALRFFYTVTLRRPWVIEQDIPTVRRWKKLPVVLSQDEVAGFLAAVDNLKHRMVLTVCYATGQRISEAVRLTPAAIDSILSDAEAQCALAWRNLQAQLRAAGMEITNLVKITTIVREPADTVAVRTGRAAVLGSHSPASTLIIGGLSNPAWKVEVEGIAVA